MNEPIAYTRSNAAEDLAESEGFCLGEVIKSARIEKGLSLRELSKRVGCSHVFLLKLESGEKAPSSKLLRSLQDELGLEPFHRLPKSELVRIKRANRDAGGTTSSVLIAIMLNALEEKGLSKSCNVGMTAEESEAGLIAAFMLDQFPDFEIVIRKSQL